MRTNEEYIKMLEPLDNYANLEYISRMNNGKINGSLAISLDKLISTIKKDSIGYAQRWISIKEELPEIGIKVLVKTSEGYYAVSGLYIQKTCDGHSLDGAKWWGSQLIVESITHWRPIELK